MQLIFLSCISICTFLSKQKLKLANVTSQYSDGRIAEITVVTYVIFCYVSSFKETILSESNASLKNKILNKVFKYLSCLL